MNVIVRDATPGDVYRVAEIHIASWRDTYQGIVPQAFLDSMDLDERAIRFYSKMGFVPDGSQKTISIDDAALQELRMTAVLKA
jgi:hypothetical protein